MFASFSDHLSLCRAPLAIGYIYLLLSSTFTAGRWSVLVLLVIWRVKYFLFGRSMLCTLVCVENLGVSFKLGYDLFWLLNGFKRREGRRMIFLVFALINIVRLRTSVGWVLHSDVMLRFDLHGWSNTRWKHFFSQWINSTGIKFYFSPQSGDISPTWLIQWVLECSQEWERGVVVDWRAVLWERR